MSGLTWPLQGRAASANEPGADAHRLQRAPLALFQNCGRECGLLLKACGLFVGLRRIVVPGAARALAPAVWRRDLASEGPLLPALLMSCPGMLWTALCFFGVPWAGLLWPPWDNALRPA